MTVRPRSATASPAIVRARIRRRRRRAARRSSPRRTRRRRARRRRARQIGAKRACGIWVRTPAPSPVRSSAPTPPRWVRLTRPPARARRSRATADRRCRRPDRRRRSRARIRAGTAARTARARSDCRISHGHALPDCCRSTCVAAGAVPDSASVNAWRSIRAVFERTSSSGNGGSRPGPHCPRTARSQPGLRCQGGTRSLFVRRITTVGYPRARRNLHCLVSSVQCSRRVSLPSRSCQNRRSIDLN